MARVHAFHSLFRCSSTYLWQLLNNATDSRCYYEPLHHFLLEISRNNEQEFAKSAQPGGNRPYLEHYLPALSAAGRGLPHFQKSFVFDDFFSVPDDQAFKAYVNSLLERAQDVQHLSFQFNRSAARLGWFQQHYADWQHWYLVRDPHDQWAAYCANSSRFFSASNFLIADRLPLSANDPLQALLPGIGFTASKVPAEIRFYSLLAENADPAYDYFLFSLVWHLSAIEALVHADHLIDVTRLSTDPAYRQSIQQLLTSELGFPLELKDWHTPVRQAALADHLALNDIDALVLDLLQQRLAAAGQSAQHPALLDFRQQCQLPNCSDDPTRLAATTQDLLRHRQACLTATPPAVFSALQEAEQRNAALRKTPAYRLGRGLLSPFHKLKMLFRT